ncbi:hypothetical protein L6452_38798 [Arctium lappa]|uniref:Uncharacterized protein n=1 Tax=Arctium lappa TaxID=4217 RepID=A0ACB8XR37_ARCLA|nr:hypothetical protein L6452_38798 [Arctium lappa]
MANNPQNSGAQFWPLLPAQQGQPFMQLASGSQQFRPLGQGMPPGQSQLPRFSHPLQQMSSWPVQPVHTTPSSLASPMPFMHPNMTSTSCSPQFQSSATTNNHVPGLGGPGVHLSSSFTFSTSAFGQAQNVMNASSHFQPVSQMHTPIAPFRGQHWLPSGTQVAPTVTPVAQTGMQFVNISSRNQVMSVPNFIQEASSDWQEYTSGDGRRYFYNKRTQNTSWEKPLELMTPLEMSWQLEGK